MTNPCSVRRRQVALLSLVSLCVARDGLAQPASRAPRLGILEGTPPEVFPGRLEAFKEGMRAAGYSDGSVQFVYRSADGKLGALPGLAAELVKLNVDLIVAATTAAAIAARDATKTIPIVFAVVADAVGAGLAESLRRPGRNLTGVTTSNTDIAQKRLEILGALLNSRAAKVAVVFNPNDASNVIGASLTQSAGRLLGIDVSPFEVRGREDFERVFVRIASERVDGVVVAAGALTDSHGRLVTELAAKARIPTIYGAPEFVETGGLVSYSASFSGNYRRAAVYVDRILRGATPAEIPVEQSSELELLINRRSAAALGLSIPASLLLQARFVG